MANIQMEAPRPLKRKLKQPQSPLACEACRAKKVRCDVTGRRSRCSRCEQSGVSCSIVPGKRRHLVQRILGVNASAPTLHTGHESASSPSTDTASPSTASEGPHSPFSTSSWGSHASSATTASVLSVSSRSGSEPRYALPKDTPLAAYIKRLPATLSRSQYNDLEAAGCLNLPDGESRMSIVETYLRRVHPTLPMIDPSQLECIAVGGPSAHRVSLLLLKSIELAANSCSEREDHDAGGLIRQIEALLKANVESDPLVVLQALILTTFSDGGKGSTKDSYHWMGTASKYAARLLRTGRITNDSRKAGRATFWSLVTRDSVVALAARRPYQVTIELSSALLSLPTEDEWFAPNSHRFASAMYGVKPRELCRSLQELCQAIRATLDVKVSQNSSTAACDPSRRLRLWHSRWYGRLSQAIGRTDNDDPVHGSVTLGYWSLAVMTLHCWSPAPTVSLRTTPSAPGDPELVSVALNTITAAYSRLFERKMAQCVPNTAIAALVPAAVAHLMNSTSQQHAVRSGNSQKYYLCWQVLRELRCKHRTAHQAMVMLDSLGQDLRQQFDSGSAEQVERLKAWCNRASASGIVCT